MPRVPCLVLSSQVQQWHGPTRQSPVKGHEDGEGTGESLLGEKAERAGILQVGEERNQEISSPCMNT